MSRNTKRRLLILTGCLCIFGCGFVTAANLSCLIEPNPNYEAAWWKVAAAAVVTLAWMEFLWRGGRN